MDSGVRNWSNRHYMMSFHFVTRLISAETKHYMCFYATVCFIIPPVPDLGWGSNGLFFICNVLASRTKTD
ncbi:CLUMA_CG006390, isoform A [Clunio marinus]|uniref:CLUMA_CG006390, isoform A n=1 Tax=Clunio marinus TaxID=568069 RepID=A0A1J1HZ93_9DIPT|nr:CLUMA_CG006390, isoform A [Clunio marinus]